MVEVTKSERGVDNGAEGCPAQDCLSRQLVMAGLSEQPARAARVFGVADGPRVPFPGLTGDGLSLGCALGYHYSAKLEEEEGRQPSRAVGSTVITFGRIKTRKGRKWKVEARGGCVPETSMIPRYLLGEARGVLRSEAGFIAGSLDGR
ncbi:hypothetical protein GE21DRAFT_2531 [Neurospora crassa]|uniref:Uncharacterized protein n=2 Tax=Neurospora crassa TaxID=5141 RepID=Q7SF42_NEUCR|nr:hypothetical protein NCU09268 [Neurospora crassa OR74A]EAA35467.1 hypothetical protein NCU09268 [Neurospora crassa OR74A]KHE83372.1 hypothetical protein GE21DRAFT_2531 [Neurospora crassa]CAE76319.1 hypothetical protein [Neurospora crassa]|eukprot:XP_964703.1 hypothetical protein NCU09268 [Neurospora crassa OR74A]